MYANYEVRSHGINWAVVHIRSGYVAEITKYRSYAVALCERYNGVIN